MSLRTPGALGHPSRRFFVVLAALLLATVRPAVADTSALGFVPADASFVVRASVAGLQRESGAAEVSGIMAAFLTAWGLPSTGMASEVVFAFVGGAEGQAVLIVRGSQPLEQIVLDRLGRSGPVQDLPARAGMRCYKAGPGAVAFADNGMVLLAAEQPAILHRMIDAQQAGGASVLPGFGAAASGTPGVLLYVYTAGMPSWARQQGAPMITRFDDRLSRMGAGPPLGPDLALLLRGRTTEFALHRGASGLMVRGRVAFATVADAQRVERAIRSTATRLSQAATSQMGELAGGALAVGLQAVEVKRDGAIVWVAMPKAIIDLAVQLLAAMA